MNAVSNRIGGLVGLMPSLDFSEKGNLSLPTRIRTQNSLSHNPDPFLVKFNLRIFP